MVGYNDARPAMRLHVSMLRLFEERAQRRANTTRRQISTCDKAISRPMRLSRNSFRPPRLARRAPSLSPVFIPLSPRSNQRVVLKLTRETVATVATHPGDKTSRASKRMTIKPARDAKTIHLAMLPPFG
jgi:hypothetical protein